MSWVPPVDIREYADRFELNVDLPGVDPSSVELVLHEGVLTLKGERRHAQVDEAKSRLWRAERRSGRFERRFVLPDAIEGDRLEAHAQHGSLTVRIPKRAEAQPQRIKIAA